MTLKWNPKFLDVAIVPALKTNNVLNIMPHTNKANSEELLFTLRGEDIGNMAISAVAASEVGATKSLSKNIHSQNGEKSTRRPSGMEEGFTRNRQNQ